MYKKIKNLTFELVALIIITVPSFLALFNSQYFTMHDDQHIARLYLLFEGLKQGQIFPRWVDMLGFGYGYPLFNFYPPLIYYVAAGFHGLGFSLIWSIKLMIVAGFISAALGIYLLIKQTIGRMPAFLGATIYTYFFYHSITVYVRGALAEFFSMSILPFIFLGIYKIYKKPDIKSILFFAIPYALLILTHPLIAFPSILFIGFFSFVLFFFSKNKIKFTLISIVAGILALGLSSFYWLPSMVERKYTLTDQILIKELANYKDHYVYLQQLWYSPWGFGGSVKGMGDGFTFQLGKIPIVLGVVSFFAFLIYFYKKRKLDVFSIQYSVFSILLVFSLFLTTSYSSFIWDKIKYLWYMQFPWRMLTFTALFISICSAFGVYFIDKSLFINKKTPIKNLVVGLLIVLVIVKYSPYFQPQTYVRTTDKERTTFEEIAWRVSSTSYEFVPKGVATKKTILGTTTLAINKNQLQKVPFEIISGDAKVTITKNIFNDKQFQVNAKTPIVFRLNNYNFPGWKVYADGVKTEINDNNILKLITVKVSQGKHTINFKFEDTLIRKIGNSVSIIFLFITMLCLYSLFRKKSLKVKK